MADAKRDKTATQQASDAKPAPVTPKPTSEVSDEALDAVAGGVAKRIV